MSESVIATLGTEVGCYIKNNNQRSANIGVIFAHGAGHLGNSVLDGDGTDKFSHILLALLRENWPVLAMDFGGANTWGSTDGTGKMPNALTQFAALGVTTTRIIGIGVSMGALTHLNYAKDNNSKYASFVGIVPVVNRKHVHDADLNSYASAIESAETAAGTTYAATADSHDPTTQAANMNFPQLLIHGNSDSIATSSDVIAYKNACPNATELQVTGGHDSSVVSPALVIDFIKANL